jgi:hypothetical protein
VARVGNFDAELNPQGWFDETFADPLNGWFDDTAIGLGGSPPPPPTPVPLIMTRGGGSVGGAVGPRSPALDVFSLPLQLQQQPRPITVEYDLEDFLPTPADRSPSKLLEDEVAQLLQKFVPGELPVEGVAGASIDTPPSPHVKPAAKKIVGRADNADDAFAFAMILLGITVTTGLGIAIGRATRPKVVEVPYNLDAYRAPTVAPAPRKTKPRRSRKKR